jgi:prolyl oligopeptidase
MNFGKFVPVALASAVTALTALDAGVAHRAAAASSAPIAPATLDRPVAAATRPPATRAETVRETLHGRAVSDAYRWLEGDNSDAEHMGKVTAEVATWTDQQNAYTRAVLDGLPGRKALEDRMRPLMQVGSVSTPFVRGERYFFSRREGSQNQPIYYYRDGLRGADKVLVDPAKLDSTGLTTVTWISPSRDGKQVAYGTYRSGDENSTLHLLDVATGALLPLTIPNKTQAPNWLPDGGGLVYQNLADASNPYSGQVMFHRTGTPVAEDAVLFRQFTKAENEKLATTWGPFGTLSDDGRWLVLGYSTSTISNDLWVVDFAAYRKTGRLEKREISVGKEGSIAGGTLGDVLYVQTTQGSPNGRVDAYDLAAAGPLRARTVIAERPDAPIQNLNLAEGRLVVDYLRNAASEIEVFDLQGRASGKVRLPGIGSAAIATESDRSEAFVRFTSFNYPTTILRVDVAKPADEATVWERPDVAVDPSTVEVEQVWYPSKDGTKISMFLVHRKGMTKNGDTPTILTGYGGFGVSETPAFSATNFQWFEAGGLYALPNLRGGGEYGDAWHEAGMLAKKQNVFDDFIAAAEWLVAQNYTRPERLGIAGGSNGGLLTGAAVVQRPDLFRAALVAVPLLDMLRYEKFLMARYWVPEYGSAEDAAQFDFLAAYSPYQHVKQGTRYPAILLTAGENDTRVHALHARKMTAELQAKTASDPATAPVLLWVDREAGHGQGKPLHLKLRDAVDTRIFFLWQLGALPGGEATAARP